MSYNLKIENFLKKHSSGILIGIVIIVGALVILYVASYFSDSEYISRERDLPNYVTLIAEIMIGVIIAITIHKISRNSQKRINQAVANIEEMVEHEHEGKVLNELELKYRLLHALESMEKICKDIKNKYDLYDENSSDEEKQWAQFNELVGELRYIAEIQIDSRIRDFEQYFVDYEIGEFKKISKFAKLEGTFKFRNRTQSGPDISKLLILLPKQIVSVKQTIE